MKVDIYQKVIQDFNDKSIDAFKLLADIDASTKGYIDDATIRAIIHFANGNLEMISKILDQKLFNIAAIKNAYNKNTEYEIDFSKTFHELGLL